MCRRRLGGHNGDVLRLAVKGGGKHTADKRLIRPAGGFYMTLKGEEREGVSVASCVCVCVCLCMQDEVGAERGAVCDGGRSQSGHLSHL